MKLLVFASGRGSNFEALLNASKKGELKSDIVGLICDKNCPAEEIARTNSIPVNVLKPKEYDSKELFISTLLETVKQYAPDYILLAGYMRIIPTELIEEYPLRIINIHPSLLPAFQGKDAILQAWQAGVKTTGVTLHFVNDKLDSGAVIAQKEIKVPDSIDALEAEIHKVEHKLYVETVKSLVEDPFDTLVVGKCLMGRNCRYDGGSEYSSRVSKVVAGFKGRVVEVCPELDMGMGVPRTTSDIVDGRFVTKEGQDLTDKISHFTNKFISENLSSSKRVIAILAEKSPSCGKVKVKGLFTKILMEKLKEKILVVTDEEL